MQAPQVGLIAAALLATGGVAAGVTILTRGSSEGDFAGRDRAAVPADGYTLRVLPDLSAGRAGWCVGVISAQHRDLGATCGGAGTPAVHVVARGARRAFRRSKLLSSHFSAQVSARSASGVA